MFWGSEVKKDPNVLHPPEKEGSSHASSSIMGKIRDIDTDEIKAELAAQKKSIDAAKKDAKKKLRNLDKVLGVSSASIHHWWNLTLASLCVFLWVAYHTEYIDGRWDARKGLLFMGAMIYCEIPVFITYLFAGCAGEDKYFMVGFVYTTQMMNLCTTIVCLIIDNGLYLFSNVEFCKL